MNVAEKLYGPVETDKKTSSSKKSSDFVFPTEKDGVHFPNSKKLALEYRQLGTRISLTRDMMNNIVVYHQSIGADKDLPTDKADLFGYLNRFHLQLAVLNPHWPGDMSFGFVYGSFFNAIMYGHVEIKGYNSKEHIRAFRTWITQSGVMDNLQRAWQKAHPETPKQITDEITETEEDIKIQAQGLVNFTPEVVKQQIETIEMIYGTYEKALNAVSGAKSYRRRLYNTREKMIKEGNWPED